MIFSSALDGFNLNKRTLFEKRNTVVQAYELFVSDIVEKKFDEYDLKTLIEKEKMVLGFNLSMTPISAYKNYILEHKIDVLSELTKYSKKTIGMISKITVIKTKQNQQMAFIEVYDGHTSMEMTVFSSTYSEYKELMDTTSIFEFDIRSNDFDGLKFIVSKMEKLK